MPLMKLHRNYTVVSLRGGAIGFEKDKPVYVPPHLVKDCVAAGAEFVDPVEKETAAVLPPEKPARVELSAEERQEWFNLAFDKLVEVNNSRDFGANAMPTIKATERETGFSNLDIKDVKAAWTKYREAKAAAE